MAGIYDLRIHHDEVVAPILRKWKVWDRDDLDAEGERAREELAQVVTQLDEQATRFEEKRAAYLEKQAARAERAAAAV
jgi:acyl-[acyl-carrier-protein] desaturase